MLLSQILINLGGTIDKAAFFLLCLKAIKGSLKKIGSSLKILYEEVIKMAHCRKTQLSIFLTYRCNLKCIYCYVGEKKQYRTTIDYQFVQRAILDFFQKYSSREIRFFATGEPTLRKIT